MTCAVSDAVSKAAMLSDLLKLTDYLLTESNREAFAVPVIVIATTLANELTDDLDRMPRGAA